jgi:hypothetical protein
MSRHVELSGRIQVQAPLTQAFMFFTPEGERAWVPGWEPEYLHPTDGALREGLTFRTRHLGEEPILWLVSRCDPARGTLEYVRITPQSRMGTVTVQCRAVDASATEATVTYRLTALSSPGEAALDVFAAEFDAMLASWESAINVPLRLSR